MATFDEEIELDSMDNYLQNVTINSNINDVEITPIDNADGIENIQLDLSFLD